MVNQHQLALAHLQAAMAAMEQCRDTLAMATIAQAMAIVGRGTDVGGLAAAHRPVANRRPC